MEVEERRIPMPWGNLAAKCWNSSTGKPVLVVHGARDNAGSFDSLIPLLSKEFYYVCVDLPGHGLSDPLTPAGVPPSFAHFVGVLLRIAWHFKWETYSLMGHSLGTHFLILVAASENDKVERLIFLDGIMRLAIEKEVFAEMLTNEVKKIMAFDDCRKKRKCTYHEALEKLVNRGTPASVPFAKSILARYPASSFDDYDESVDSQASFTIQAHFTPELYRYISSQVRCPVLVIFAQQSILSVVHATYDIHLQVTENLTSKHPCSKVFSVEGDHLVHAKEPGRIAPIINNFFEDTKNCIPSNNKAKL